MLNVTFTVDNNDVDVREEEVDITAVEDDDTKEISRTRAVGVGCTISKPEQQYFCIERFMDKPQDFEYLTGFVSYEHFQLLFRALGPAAHQLSHRSKSLAPENELFLTLVKLRQGNFFFFFSLSSQGLVY